MGLRFIHWPHQYVDRVARGIFSTKWCLNLWLFIFSSSLKVSCPTDSSEPAGCTYNERGSSGLRRFIMRACVCLCVCVCVYLCFWVGVSVCYTLHSSFYSLLLSLSFPLSIPPLPTQLYFSFFISLLPPCQLLLVTNHKRRIAWSLSLGNTSSCSRNAARGIEGVFWLEVQSLGSFQRAMYH